MIRILFPFVPANPLSRSHKLEDFFQLTPHPSSRLNLTLSVASGTSEAHVRCTIALKARVRGVNSTDTNLDESLIEKIY